MGKRKNNDNGPTLFSALESRRRSALIIRRFLVEEAEKVFLRDQQQADAYEIVKRWADLETKGHLARKETALDADFLREVFGSALGYRLATESPLDYQLERNFTVAGVGVADGALGNFTQESKGPPLAVIELKAAHVNLDKDKFNGRTPVQQCWDYLNALPECPWGIVSNFVSFRLYHRDKTPLAYEEFRLQALRDLRKFRQFYCLFERGGLVRPLLVRPLPGYPLRALNLLERTENRQREVGDQLYDLYSEERVRLIEHLCHDKKKSLDRAIHIAQKILDRIIFIAFCEDRDLLPAQCIDKAYRTLPPFSKVTNPRWRNFLDLFHAIDQGHPDFGLATGYDGGLFAHDPEVDDLQLDDEWTNFFRSVGAYDFRDEVNVDVLGHIFEKSVAELEKMRVGGLFALEANGAPSPAMRKSAERKRFGIYYTPPEFTRFIVRNTVAKVIEERLEEVRVAHGLEAHQTTADEPSPRLAGYWRDCLRALRTVKVCDPACGSGAFLVQAYEVLDESYTKIVDELMLHDGPAADKLEEAVPEMILADNLYGVDVSPQAVEITQLALWIRSARRNRTLADLSRNIVLGNSLVSAPEVHPRAMDWEARFPDAFSRAENPGFDCVVGNPPWERLKLQEREFFAFSAPKIAGAVSAARRREMIQALEKSNPELYAQYQQAKEAAEKTLAHVRSSGNFPLTAKGDVNTYVLFAELAHRIVAPRGLPAHGQGRREHVRPVCRARTPDRRPPGTRGPVGAVGNRYGQNHEGLFRAVDAEGFADRALRLRKQEADLPGRGWAVQVQRSPVWRPRVEDARRRLRVLCPSHGGPDGRAPARLTLDQGNGSSQSEYTHLPRFPLTPRRRVDEGDLPPRAHPHRPVAQGGGKPVGDQVREDVRPDERRPVVPHARRAAEAQGQAARQLLEKRQADVFASL